MDMIERVARSMAEADGWPSLEIARRSCGGENSCDFDLCARAAIAAMREPTEEMLTAADLRDGICTSYDELWKTMIDAALECPVKPDVK